MALQGMDSCDLYSTRDDVWRRYPQSYLPATLAVDPTGGRFGGPALVGAHASYYITLPVTGAPTTYYFAASLKAAGLSDNANQFLTFHNAAGDYILSLTSGSEGVIRALRGPEYGTLLGASTLPFISLISYWAVEIKVVINNGAGSVEVRRKGEATPILNLTSQNTEGATGGIGFIRLWIGSQCWWYIDDFYHYDTTGSGVTDFLGDRRIDYIKPNGDGTVQLTKSGGSTNWELVDDTPGADDDSTYVYSSTITNKDILNLTTISGTAATVDAVQAVVVAKKSDAGAASLKVGVKAGTTEGKSGSEGLGTDYEFYDHIEELNPDDSLAWAQADIDALQVLYEVT